MLPFGAGIVQKCSSLARQARPRSTGWTSSSPPFLHNGRLGDFESLFLHMPYIIRPRRLPLGGFPPLWLSQSRHSMRLSMTPQRLGRTQISLSLGLVSGYGIAVPPMAADPSLVFHHGPTIPCQLRTHCIQSICEACPSSLVGWRRCSFSRHNCTIAVSVRHHTT